MATLVPGDLVRLRVVSATSDQLGLNILIFKVLSAVGTSATTQEFVDFWDNIIAPRLRPLLSQSATYRGCGAQRVVSPVEAEDISITGAGVGTSGAGLLPTQVSGIVSWKTALSGKRTRGRSYIPFPSPSDDNGAGVPTANYQTRTATLVAGLIGVATIGTLPNQADVRLVVYHRSPGTPSSQHVLSGFAGTKWATQRRRGGFGATNVAPF